MACRGIDRTHQLADFWLSSQARVMPNMRRRQDAAEVGRWISIATTSPDRVAKDLAAPLLQPLGGLELAQAFGTTENNQHFRRRDRPDWALADPGKRVRLE